jgi:chorismate mutase / prephenate dehydratase
MRTDIPRPAYVAYLGPAGSYTFQAARSLFGEPAKYVDTPAHKVPSQARHRVGTHGSSYGVLPVENIVAGFIQATFDALYNTANVSIVNEVYLPISFSLATRAANLAQVKVIRSHEAALAQCRRSLDRLDKRLGRAIPRASATSTSAAVLEAASDPTVAALGSDEAAALYDVPVVLQRVQDHPHCMTRFWAFTTGSLQERSGNDKTVFMVELDAEPKSIYMLMKLFEQSEAEICWINSRVIPSKSGPSAWRYAYFVECSGHIEDAHLRDLHRVLRRPDLGFLCGRRGRLLGSFPAAAMPQS